MKRGILFLTFLWAFAITAQSELLNVSAQVVINGSDIVVEQSLILNLPDSVQGFQLKALDFKGTTLSEISAKSENTNLNLTKSYTEGLNLIQLAANDSITFKNVVVKYKVAVEDADFYLPLFFTNLPAASSDNEFFKMNIKMLEKQAYAIHFPKVKTATKAANQYKEIMFQVPALPSLIRIELYSPETSKFNFIDIVDWVVGLVFVIIGFFIWLNRKKLMYG